MKKENRLTEEIEEEIGRMCDHFCKYQEVLQEVKAEQGREMVKRLFCDNCPLKAITKELEGK